MARERAKERQRTKGPTSEAVERAAREISRTNAPDTAVVRHLQIQVANAFLLYANYKRYHWQCFGPLFRDLHRLFDELAQDVQGTLDPLAERLRMIGQDPVASPAEVTEMASVKAASLGHSMREMVQEADAHAVTVIREMRKAVDAAEEAGDPGTADLFVRFVQIHEKHEWWLRDLLESGDRLVS